jgi:hypothetical protein
MEILRKVAILIGFVSNLQQFNERKAFRGSMMLLLEITLGDWQSSRRLSGDGQRLDP